MASFPLLRRITSLLVLISLPPSLFAQNNPAPAKPRLGMNLAGPADWNTELPFVDVFRMSRPWISQQKGKSWGQGPRLALDQYGWITKLESDCWAETPLCTIDGGHYPGGKYTILYEGNGKLDVWNDATIISQKPGRMIIDVNSAKGGFFLKLLETDPSNYIRNIRVIMPGYENTYKQNPFHPAFLKRWQGVACFRFMDWMHTNGSKIKSWSDRSTLLDATFSKKGVPLEWMIDLCNRQNADAWFCMPHLADDDYIRNFARAVKAKLNPQLKIYIEYSNEVWNSQFQQTRYSWEKAKELNLGNQERPWEGGGQYYSKRSMEIFKIWEEVFGSRVRLIRVLAWQSGNTWWMEQIILPFQDACKHADALAIAPYISMNVPRQGKNLTADQVSQWSIQKTMDYMENQSLPKSIDAIRRTKEVADKYGLLLLAYEGGQHMVGVGGGENNDAMTKLFHQCNAHPRMGTIYKKYYDAWGQTGGDLFCYFSSVSRWSKWGSWGILQHYDDDPAQSPKFTATFHWAKSQGQNVNLP